MRGLIWLLIAIAVVAGCSPGGDSRAQAAAVDTAHPWRKPGDKIDSLLPMAEYLWRFRAGLTEPGTFEGGDITPDALARRYLIAINQRDSVALYQMVVTRSEYAWLVFPDQIYSRPPYDLDPDVAWIQLSGENGKGLARVLARYGGRPLRFERLACARDTVQVVSGPNIVWRSCRVRFRIGDSVETRQLFGSIVQREGRAKFLSFHSEF